MPSQTIKHTITLNNPNISEKLRIVSITGDTVLFNKPTTTETYLTYRTYSFPKSLRLSLHKKSMQSTGETYIGLLKPGPSSNPYIFNKQLHYNGSFGRGLSIGNNQSLVLNSNFNLQLAGLIGDDIQIRAVLSDANIPIQAEGNTKQLQDFDQVYITLQKGIYGLQAGDIQLKAPNSYFIQYNKRLKGIQFHQSSDETAFGKSSYDIAIAIDGGKYNRQSINAIDGNQGPYKLTGANRESFIIVQSNTEKVYIDGRLLTRGVQNDYIISYDRAELSFTENQLITKDSRIIVEFEYKVQNYAKTVLAFNNQLKTDHFHINFYAYREHDNKNAAGLTELSEQDKKQLQFAGDRTEEYRQPSIAPIEYFDPNQAQYTYLFNNEAQQYILTYSADSTKALYQALFTDVGANNGSYEIATDININNRVYTYVGTKNGRYEPYKVLTAPESKSMYATSVAYKTKQTAMYSEISLSHYDKNLFSKKDQKDNIGYAFKTAGQHKFLIRKAKIEYLNISASTEFTDINFNPINQYRQQEFSRDWNLFEMKSGKQIHASGQILLKQINKNEFAYETQVFKLENFIGLQHKIRGIIKNNWLRQQVQFSALNSSSDDYTTQFIRPSIETKIKLFKKSPLELVGKYNGEKNQIIQTGTTLKDSRSQAFNDFQLGFQTLDTLRSNLSVFYSSRTDEKIFQNEWRSFSKAHNITCETKWKNTNQDLGLTVTYRNIDYNQQFGQTNQRANQILGALIYNFNFFQKKLIGSLTIRTNSGLEPKLEFDYKEVQKGEGQYVWIDDGDGVQQKHEFQIAPFKDQANFIRFSLFNNEYAQIFNQEWIQTLQWNPVKWKLSNHNVKRFLGKISTNQRFSVKRKDYLSEQIPWIFSSTKLDGTNALASYLQLWSSNVSWNKGNPNFDLQTNYIQTNVVSLLTTGNESRQASEWNIKARSNYFKVCNITLLALRKINNFQNLLFPENNYNITTQEYGIENTFTIQKNIQASAKYSYSTKNNIADLGHAQSNIFLAKATYANSTQFRLSSELKYQYINFENSPNQTINFLLLEGLQNGNNVLWNIAFTKRIFKNFDWIINYQGRKTGILRTIHTGTMQIRATF